MQQHINHTTMTGYQNIRSYRCVIWCATAKGFWNMCVLSCHLLVYFISQRREFAIVSGILWKYQLGYTLVKRISIRRGNIRNILSACGLNATVVFNQEAVNCQHNSRIWKFAIWFVSLIVMKGCQHYLFCHGWKCFKGNCKCVTQKFSS